MSTLRITQKFQSITNSTEWWQGPLYFSYLTTPASFLFWHLNQADAFWPAFSLHLLFDFAIQSPQTAHNKATGDFRALVIHSLISGFFPLIWLDLRLALIGALVHLGIDSLNKFGLKGWVGGYLDQGLHLVSILLILRLST